MVVAVTENVAFQPPRTIGQRITNQGGRHVIEGAVAFTQPPSVEPVEARSLKGPRGVLETFIGAHSERGAQRRPLFEIPLQFLDSARVSLRLSARPRLTPPAAASEVAEL